LATAPNLAYAHHELGATLIFSGRPKEGLAALGRSIRLDPRAPESANRLNQLALGFYFCREYAAAVEAAKRAIRAYPDYPNYYRWLAAALRQLGRIEEAKEALKMAIAIAPASFDMYVRGRAPWMRPEDVAHMLEGVMEASPRANAAPNCAAAPGRWVDRARDARESPAADPPRRGIRR
jgi:adenylate cyclase